MSRTYALLVALSTALASLFAPQHESTGRGPKALVYCPASDVSGCTAVVNALAGAFPGGVDRGYDGGNGTVDLAKVDLMQYSVLVVPSLADRDAAKPYALLRDPVVAGRLKETFIGRVAFWSGTPDLGQANRAEKDALIRNLAAWATSNRAMLFRRGMVVLQDLSEDVARRYDWVPAIARVSVTADAAVRVYGSVSTPTDVGKAILDDGGTPLHFENMAAFGLRVATGTTASL
ncbi:MAG TPA: hypothetical protein VFQ38_02755, partial [Longimicrobiales bacterium]|nr:hypothetical protein [Longimicrobiales bacterium]